MRGEDFNLPHMRALSIQKISDYQEKRFKTSAASALLPSHRDGLNLLPLQPLPSPNLSVAVWPESTALVLCGNLLSISRVSYRHTKGLQASIYQKGENWSLGGYLVLQVTAAEEKVDSWPPTQHQRLPLHLSASPTSPQLVCGGKLAPGKSQEATIPLWGGGVSRAGGWHPNRRTHGSGYLLDSMGSREAKSTRSPGLVREG